LVLAQTYRSNIGDWRRFHPAMEQVWLECECNCGKTVV
jgi:hypothetical protein